MSEANRWIVAITFSEDDDHHRLDLGTGPGWHPMRPRRSVAQARITLRLEPGDPPVRTLPGHAHRPSDMRDRHPLLSNTTNQQTATMHRQPSVTVRHEDLRVVETAIPTASEVFSSHQRTVTNVPAGYT